MELAVALCLAVFFDITVEAESRPCSEMIMTRARQRAFKTFMTNEYEHSLTYNDPHKTGGQYSSFVEKVAFCYEPH